jgi:hypothetical protein
VNELEFSENNAIETKSDTEADNCNCHPDPLILSLYSLKLHPGSLSFAITVTKHSLKMHLYFQNAL